MSEEIQEGDHVVLRVRVARANSEQAFIGFTSMEGPYSIRVPLSELLKVTAAEPVEQAAEVLIVRHRRNQVRYVTQTAFNWFCDCGSSGGASSRTGAGEGHARHVAAALRDAGLLAGGARECQPVTDALVSALERTEQAFLDAVIGRQIPDVGLIIAENHVAIAGPNAAKEIRGNNP